MQKAFPQLITIKATTLRGKNIEFLTHGHLGKTEWNFYKQEPDPKMNAFARNEEHLYPVRESRVDQSQCLLPVLFSDPRSFLTVKG